MALPLNAQEWQILAAVDGQPSSLHQVAVRSGQQLPVCYAVLMKLERESLVIKQGDKYPNYLYVRREQ